MIEKSGSEILTQYFVTISENIMKKRKIIFFIFGYIKNLQDYFNSKTSFTLIIVAFQTACSRRSLSCACVRAPFGTNQASGQ